MRKGYIRVDRSPKRRFVRFEIPKLEREPSSIGLSEPRKLELNCISLPGSPKGRIEGEVVHLGYGLPEDFKNEELERKIVVTRSDVPTHEDRWIHRRDKYFRAYKHGAGSFVFQSHVEGCLPPTGSVGGGTDIVGPLPAVGVSKEIGERLRGTMIGEKLELA